MPTIRIESIKIDGDRGAVVYELKHPDGRFSYMRQPFRKGHHGRDSKEMWWGWDGREPVTLVPSFRCTDGNIEAHLFLRNGKIELCGDSTVTLGEKSD